jgi:hypothetical protein
VSFNRLIAGTEPELIPHRQELFHGGVKLELDHKSIQHYDIQPGATIHLLDKGA